MDPDKIKETLRKFTEERDWEQFHNPKNLATALSGVATKPHQALIDYGFKKIGIGKFLPHALNSGVKKSYPTHKC